MKANKIILREDVLHDQFRFDPESGKLFWKHDNGGGTAKAGDEAGYLDTESEPETVLRHGARYRMRRIILHSPIKVG